MQRSEIIKGLQAIAEEMPCAADDRGAFFGPGDMKAIEAAIALLTPEPITEDGLRGPGFRELLPGIWKRCLPDGFLLYSEGSTWLHQPGSKTRLHITDMQHLRGVIAALEGVKADA